MNRFFFKAIILICIVRESFSQCRLYNESCTCFPQGYIDCLENKSEEIAFDFNQLIYDKNLNYQSLKVSNKNIKKVISTKTNETFSFSSLSLSENKLTSIGSFSFYGMKKLTLLSLTMVSN